MGNSPRRRNADTRHHLAIGGVAVLAVVTAGLVVAAVVPRETSTTNASTPRVTPSSIASETPTAELTTPTIESRDLASVVALLADPSQPLTLTVIGDSTGNDGDEWVAELGRTIAADYGRTVSYSTWDVASSTYGTAVTYGTGAGEPVTIWNGSASGLGPDYSLANLPALAPQASDLLIVSHGHNFTAPNTGAAQEAEVVTATAEQWGVAPAVAVVLQNPRITDASAQDANLKAVASTFADSGYTMVDVAGAFRAQPDLAPLLQADGTHPSADGQALWFDTMRAALGI